MWTDCGVGARAFPQNLITEKGAFQLYDVKMGRRQLRGHLEPNAWAALAFLEGYRDSHIDAYRHAAQRVLTYAEAELLDTARGCVCRGQGFFSRAGCERDHG